MPMLYGGDSDGFIINATLAPNQQLIVSPKGGRYLLRTDGNFYVEGCKWDCIPPIARGD